MKQCFIILLMFTFSFKTSLAQDMPKPEDTEFKDTGTILVQLKLHNGLTTNFKSAPDLYVGGIQLAGYWTPEFLVHVARVGLIADGFYTDKKLQAAFGAGVLFKLKTFQSDPLGRFGSIGNIHLAVDHLWGTTHYRLLGGGIGLESDLLTIGLMSRRDYSHNRWWFETHIGIRLSKKPKVKSVDEMPHNPN